MKRRYYLLVALAAICYSPLIPAGSLGQLAAQESDSKMSVEKVGTVEGVSEYRFSNGARLLLYPEGSAPTVTVNMTVLVGSRHEGYGEAGMAHLLEHMVFKGTDRHPNVPKLLGDYGARFNGTTNVDRTNYFETLPASDKNLEFAIDLECDRLMNSWIKHEDLQSEFSVVRSEFERGENSPAGVLGRRVTAAAYEWHNYGKTTIGNRSDIERVPIDRLRAFYRKYYQPNNVVLIVTGRFEEETALKFAKKHLGSIPKTREIPKTYTEEPAQDGERYVELRRVGKVGSMIAAYHVPAAAHEDWAPLSMLGSVLSESKVGVLESELVETSLATGVSAFSASNHDPGLFRFSLTPAEGKMEKAKGVLTKIMDGLGEIKFDSAALDRAKARSARRAENMMNNASRVAQQLSSASALGDWRLMFLQRDRVQEVTMEDLRRVAATYFVPHNRTVGVFVPTDSPRRMEVPSVASIADVVKDYKGGVAIAKGEAFDPTPENLDNRIKSLEMNGMKVAMLEKKNTGETVNMTVTLRYGNEDSLAGNTTAAGMVSGMLMAGTKTMDRQALQQRMTELGIRIGGGGGRRRGGGSGGGGTGSLSFSIQAKRSSLVPAIDLLGEILRQPAWPEEVFEQTKMRQSSGMKRFATEPNLLAGIEMNRAMSQYKKGDVRYVPTLEEMIEQIDAVTLEDVKKVYETQLSAKNGEIAIVGDFEKGPALEALSKVLQDWDSSVEYRKITREAMADFAGEKRTINTPDKANAQYSSGMVFGLNEKDADTEALLLGNFILGGGTLNSRLGNRIRQRDGLSYGVNSSMSIPSEGNRAQFSIRAICNPTNMDAVEKAAMEELTKFIDDGPTDDEVKDAITGWLERQKVSRSSDGAISGQMINNLNLERTFRFTAEREKKIAGITKEAIQAAFKKHIDPTKLMIIRAGDLEK